MRYVILLSIILLMGCSTTKPIGPVTKNKLQEKQDFLSSQPNEVEILLGDGNTSLQFPDIFRFKINNIDYYLPIKLSSNSNDNSCPYENALITVDQNSLAGLPFKHFEKLRLKSLCNYSDPEKKFRKEVVLSKMQKQLKIVQPNLTGSLITIRKYGSKILHLKRYGLLIEGKNSFELRNKIINTYTEKEFSMSNDEKFNRFSEMVRHTDRTKSLNTLLFNSLVAHKDIEYRVPDLSGLITFNQFSPIGFKNLVYYSINNSSILSTSNFDNSYFMKYQLSKTNTLVEEKTGCDSQYCLQQFLSIQKWRSFYTRKEMTASIKFFHKNKNYLQQIITDSNLENEDKFSSLHLIRSFYKHIAKYDQVPVLTGKAIPIYRSTKLERACGDDESGLKMFVRAPAGLPAFVLEKNDNAKKVLLFDTRDGSMINPLTEKSCLNTNNENWLHKEATISPNWPTK